MRQWSCKPSRRKSGVKFTVTIIPITLLCVPLVLMNMVFVIEVLAGLLPEQNAKFESAPRQNVVIIVPAHNEQSLIEATLSALIVAAQDKATILVVADNCTDSTADLGRSQGVNVTERFDTSKIGKGFALDHARSELRRSPPDLVVVFDADCQIDAGSLDALIHGCWVSGSPVQAVYLLRPDRDASPIVQISTFAFFVRNSIRQRGLQRLAGSVHLTGTGMAFPWPVFESANLATASIVEDFQLGIDLAACGKYPQLISQATVWSPAANESETMIQRSRWEGGFLTTTARHAPGLLLRALMRGSARQVFASLDLFIPPVSLLLLGNFISFLVCLSLTLLAGLSKIFLLTMSSSCSAVGIAITIVWIRQGQVFISLKALISVPPYFIQKILLHAKLAWDGAPTEWRRTNRGPKK